MHIVVQSNTFQGKHIHKNRSIFSYMGSCNSTDVGAKGNRTIEKTVLMEDCSKMVKIYFQSPLFPQKSLKNRTIARNLGKIVLIANRTIARTVLIESVLLEDPLYI